MSGIDVFENESDTRRQHWTFAVATHIGARDEVKLILDSYTIDERESTRHKWRSSRGWYRSDERAYRSQIDRNDVVVPDWVVDEAKQRIVVTFVPLEPRPENQPRY